VDAAAQGRNQLQGLKTRLAANFEFSLCNSVGLRSSCEKFVASWNSNAAA
jgi:hypothetical protein